MKMLSSALAIFLSALAAAAPSAASAKATLDRAYLVGFWTEDGDCANAVHFAADGRFITANGGTGRWRLAGNRLTMTGSATIAVRIVPVDRDRVDVINPNGSIGHSTRCAGPNPADAPVRDDVT
jgi:hypothetical protein